MKIVNTSDGVTYVGYADGKTVIDIPFPCRVVIDDGDISIERRD